MRWICVFAALIAFVPMYADEGSLSIRVREGASSRPLPCRIHLQGSEGPVQAPGLPFWKDHFVCPGDVELELSAGDYRLTVERGPEYRRFIRRDVKVVAGESRSVEVRLERLVDMAADGWWSGETHVHRSLDEMPLHLRAEDLHVAPVLTIWNRRSIWIDRELPGDLVARVDENRYYHWMSAEDERGGGALFFHHLRRPLDFRGQQREFPSPMKNLREALKQDGVEVEIEKPFWWDVPTWLASGKIRYIGLANNHMCRSTMYANEAWGRPRDADRLPPPRGNGFFSQELYYRVLNCGFRISPVAGSASGVLPNPVGYNRVYVHLDGDLDYDKWWRGLRAGRCFVTNGPMLRVEVDGQKPGAVFRLDSKSPRTLSLKVSVLGDDPLEAVELVRDGKVENLFRKGESARRRFETTREFTFDRSGWFLVRAICDVPRTFRFASTAPFYVELDGKRSTIHRADVEYFLHWIEERKQRLRSGPPKLAEDELEAVLAPHEEAEAFYRRRLEAAE